MVEEVVESGWDGEGMQVDRRTPDKGVSINLEPNQALPTMSDSSSGQFEASLTDGPDPG